jgi:ABC-type sugar transport system permease subunit
MAVAPSVKTGPRARRAGRFAALRHPQRRAALAFAAPAALLLAALVVWPLIDGIRLSLHRISPTATGEWAGLANYKAVFADAAFWHSVVVTLEFAVLALVIEFLLGFGLALLMSKIVRGGGVLRTLVLIPTMLTPAVAALNFRTMLNYDFGVINYVIEQFGVAARPWVSDPSTALLALVATDVWRSTPFFVLVLTAGLLALSPEMLEAADLDGANAWKKLIYVKVPMLLPLILVTVLFRVIDLFRTFDIVYVLTQGGPGDTTDVASLRIYNDMYIGNFTSYAATEATVFMVLTLIVAGLLVPHPPRTDDEKGRAMTFDDGAER